MTDPAPAAAPGRNQLRAGALRTVDVFAQTIAGYFSVGSATFVTSLVAASAGLATPLAMLLAGLGCVVTALVIAQFARRLPHAGAIYEYAGHAWGPRIGAAAGWTDFCALALVALALLFGLGHWTSQFLREYVHFPIHWYGITLAVSIPAAALTILDVRISTRTQMTCVGLSLTVVGLLVGRILIQGGAAGHTWAPFQISTAPGGWSGIGFGLVFAMSFLVGFEAPATLSEETVNPKRTIPLVIVAAPAVLTLYLVLVTYAYAIGYGSGGAAEWGKDSTALLTMAARYVGVWLVPVVFLAALLDAFGCLLAVLGFAARLCYALARDGLLPRPFGRTHPRFQTPHIAILAILGSGLVLGLAFLREESGGYLGFSYMLGTCTLLFEILYILVAGGAFRYFRRGEPGAETGDYSLFRHRIAPVLSIFVCLAALYASLQPAPVPLLRTMPFLAAGLVGIGAVLSARRFSAAGRGSRSE